MRLTLILVSLGPFSPLALAQCPVSDAQAPAAILNYPMVSDRYAVQYSVGGGPMTNANAYISYYGSSLASPPRKESGYVPLQESLSFVSIPATANSTVQIRVSKIFGTPFQASDGVSIRPSVKPINVTTLSDGTAQVTTTTASGFSGDQFFLWWSRDAADGGGVESLVFFLNPPYSRPAGANVKVIGTPSDLTGNLSAYDTLDFEGPVAVGSTGDMAFIVPSNIINIFLGPAAWVKGKLRFSATTVPVGMTRHIYGPGVLDGSMFDYEKRDCGASSAYPDQGYYALTSEPGSAGNSTLDKFIIDGIAVTDHNHAGTDLLRNSLVNNVKTLGWNGENASLRLGDSTTVSNTFIRSGDDSLMVWGASDTVINATVWQNYNGGAVNLGWANNTHGDYSLIDGLYVVKTDWTAPANPSWTELPPTASAAPLQNQNNAVFASLMTPGTTFGAVQPPVYRNIFVEDPPQVLFSLKILPPICAQNGATCLNATLTDSSSVKLSIENLSSPTSVVSNSIGFQTLPAGFSQDSQTFSSAYTFTGTMNVDLAGVMLTPSSGTAAALTNSNATSLGKLTTNGANVNLAYSPVGAAAPQVATVANAEGEVPVIAPNTWVEVKGFNLAPAGDSRIWSTSDFVNNKLPTALDGVSMTVNGKSVFIYYISPTQINILTPPDAIQGLAQVVVTNNGATSAVFQVQAQPLTPSFFAFNGGPYVAAVHTSGALIGPASLYPGSTTPAKPGETVLLFANGFGSTSAPVVSGSVGQSGTLSPLPTVNIGGVAANVTFAGLVSPGEFQFNVVVPASLANGDQPITATYNGVSTQAGTLITIHN